MANNRRHQSGAVRFMPALKAVVLCTLIGGSCVGYVLQKKKIYDLAQQKGVRQGRLELLRKENQKLANNLASLQSPTYLKDRVPQLNLARPTPAQMIWITEYPPGAPLYAPTNGEPVQYVRSGR